MISAASGTLPVRYLLAYALPAFVVALPTIPVYIHLPSLYGVQLGVGLATTGYVLLAARLFDTVTDPLVGILCDRLSIWGLKRKPWIAVGAIIAGIGLYRILTPPDDVTAAYLLVWSLVLYGGWTMVAVPYLAWGAELSSNYHERTRITAWREGFALLGIIGAGVIGAITVSLGWSDRASIGSIAWAAILLGVVAIPLLLRAVPERAGPATRSPGARDGGLMENLQALGRNKLFLRLLVAWFANGVANGIPAALFFIYLEHGLGADSDVRPLFVLLYFVAAIASIPLWYRLSAIFGKHRVWCWGMIAACLAFVTVPLIDVGAYYAFGAVCIVTGMALGADLSLPPALQADVTDYAAYRFGHAQTGLQFALWGMSTKLALAVAVGVALPGLELSGFDPQAPSEAGRSALLVIYALIPVVIKAAAITMVWRFPLTAQVQAAMRRRIENRGAVQAGDGSSFHAQDNRHDDLRNHRSKRMHKHEIE